MRHSASIQAEQQPDVGAVRCDGIPSRRKPDGREPGHDRLLSTVARLGPVKTGRGHIGRLIRRNADSTTTDSPTNAT